MSPATVNPSTECDTTLDAFAPDIATFPVNICVSSAESPNCDEPL